MRSRSAEDSGVALSQIELDTPNLPRSWIAPARLRRCMSCSGRPMTRPVSAASVATARECPCRKPDLRSTKSPSATSSSSSSVAVRGRPESGACCNAACQASSPGTSASTSSEYLSRAETTAGSNCVPLRRRAMATAGWRPYSRRCTSATSASWTTRISIGMASPWTPIGSPVPSQRSKV